MNKLIKSSISFALSLVLLLSISINAFAVGTERKPSVQNLLSSVVKSAYVPSVNATGENLKSDVQDGLRYQNRNSNVIINSATFKEESISICGSINGENFELTGIFSGISDNGNVVAFKSKDQLDNYRVVYCAVEKNITDSSLYFKSFANANPAYNVVTKLYLAPKTGNDYIMVEMFGNEFPDISAESIANLPADHQVNLYWYAREFEPVDKSVTKEQITTRSGNPSYILLGYYEYYNLGMRYQHYIRYEEQCDIRDVARNASSTASATLEVKQKWITAELPNDCSTTYSTLSLRNVSLLYLTRTNTAVQQQISTGTVTQNGAIVTSFNYGLGVGIKGISATPSINFTWEPGNENKNAGVNYAAHTNSVGSYWREAEAKLKSSQYLNSIGNKFMSNWTYGAYEAYSASSANAKLVFKYTLYNMLDYTNTQDIIDERIISVNVT